MKCQVHLDSSKRKFEFKSIFIPEYPVTTKSKKKSGLEKFSGEKKLIYFRFIDEDMLESLYKST
jgi:hypothetical protein